MKSLNAAAIALLASTVFLTPALAAEVEAVEPTTPGFKLLRSEELLTENVEPMPLPAIKAGEMDVLLEKTTLTELAAAFGGDIATSNKENAGISWLCYAISASDKTPATLVWFASDGIMGMNYGVNFVIAEVAPEGETPTCAAPTVPLTLTTGFPGVGAPVADVTATFGLEPKDGTLSYGGEAPVPDYLAVTEGATARVMNYIVAGGLVTAATLMQVTAN